jgi:beta-glucosidase
MASTWDPDLVERMTKRIREQLNAIGWVHALSPVLDVARDPRWGRTEETFGEDPYLVAEMASAYVRGLQGDDPTEGISATVKHLVGHAISEDGKNRSSVSVGEREVRETHLFPFEAAIREEGAESVMNAYHDVDSVPCGADESLLTGILREEWGFDGTVVADYFSVRFLQDEHHVADDYQDAAVQALEASIDVELPKIKCYDESVDAVEEGNVAEETIEVAARRVLRQKVRKGVPDGKREPDPDAVERVFGPEAGRDYAHRLARESITLLKNEHDLLSLEDVADENGDSTIAVLGPKADSPVGQLGDQAYAAHYPDRSANRAVTTPLEALTDRLGGDRVDYVEGCTTTGPDADGIDESVAAAEGADVAVAFVGTRSAIALSDPEDDIEERPDVPTSGEGADVTDLDLPGVQQELVEAANAAYTPLVVVQISGKHHSIEWIDQHVPAVLHAWHPGEEGGAGIVDVLLGEHNPSGRLPISIPKTVGQIPIHYSRTPNSREERHVYADSDPLWPFGFSESYTEFDYSKFALDANEIGPAETITAEVTVENASDRAGYEVVQLYTSAGTPSIARPVQELTGFQRVHLEPGEAKTVTFDVAATQLAYHDREMELTVEEGSYEARVGSSAADIAASGSFTVADSKPIARSGRAYFTDADVDAAE